MTVSLTGGNFGESSSDRFWHNDALITEVALGYTGGSLSGRSRGCIRIAVSVSDMKDAMIFTMPSWPLDVLKSVGIIWQRFHYVRVS